jgi:hypothetical protein
MTIRQEYKIFTQLEECFGGGPDCCWVILNDTHPIGIYDTYVEAQQAQPEGYLYGVAYQKILKSTIEDDESYIKIVRNLMNKIDGSTCARIGWISVLFFYMMKHEHMLLRHDKLNITLREKVVEFKSYIEKNSNTYSSKTITKTMPEFMNRINPWLHRIPTHSYNLRSRK